MRSIFITQVFAALPDYAAHDDGGGEEQPVRAFIHLINRPKKGKWLTASMIVIAASTTVSSKLP